MKTEGLFEQLSEGHQQQAKSLFAGARAGDGYIYSSDTGYCFDRDGNILCRKRLNQTEMVGGRKTINVRITKDELIKLLEPFSADAALIFMTDGEECVLRSVTPAWKSDDGKTITHDDFNCAELRFT